MRISELLGLQWGDIDWDAQIIHLNRTGVYGEIAEGKINSGLQSLHSGRAEERDRLGEPALGSELLHAQAVGCDRYVARFDRHCSRAKPSARRVVFL